jgi:imidazolonepropionase-like amidohydrolase
MSRRLASAAVSFATILLPGLLLAQPVALVGARIETAGPLGTIEQGTLVMDGGRIVSVSAGTATPAGARVIDMTGRTLSPGLILATSNLGVAEIDQVPETRDDGAGELLGAAFDPSAGVNPDTPTIQLARLNGVTRAFITPVSGRGDDGHAHDDSAFATSGSGHAEDPALFSGQVTGLSLADGLAQPVFRTGAGVVLDMGEAGAEAAGGSRGASFTLVRQALADTRRFAAARARFEAGEGPELSLGRLDLIAMIPVIQRQAPLLVRVSRASDIRQVLALARAENIRVVLEGAEEGWRVAPEIAAAGAPVILDPEASTPASFEALGSTLENAAILSRAGVSIAIMGSRAYNSLRQSRFNAGTATSYGLPRQTAIQAITLTPARIWGVDRETGSLEPGKSADIVAWTGDPLEPLSYPVSIWIAGAEQPMRSRSTDLRDRYRPQPEGAPPPAWRVNGP